MMKKIFYYLPFVLLLIFTAGCGNNCTVSGKVTFSDGTPMSTGEVVFETAAIASRGRIQKDGSYTISTGEQKGVPKGTYNVSIGGFSPTVEANPAGGVPRITAPVIPVAKKFLSPGTSGLTCEVKGSMKYNITVEPPQ